MGDVRFTIGLAGLAIDVEVLHGQTRDFCKDYLIERPLSECAEQPQPEPAAFAVRVSADDIADEHERSAQQNRREGIPVRRYADEYVETLALYRKIAEGLLPFDTLLFHGSAIAVDGSAYLFAAKSGTGKSTHARLWREVLGQRAVMINDDKPLLHIGEQGTTVFGTPWDGKHHLSMNGSAPLRAICFLSQGSANSIRRIPAPDALTRLLEQTYCPQQAASDGSSALVRVLELFDRMARHVEFYEMACLPDLDAARMSFAAMGGTA